MTTPAVRLRVFRHPGWLGLRLGRRYWIVRDLRRHPLRFSERNRISYRPLVRLGDTWEFGVK